MHDKQRPGGVSLTVGGTAIEAPLGSRLLDAILDSGIEHRHVCGGRGFCTSCRVEVIGDDAGLSPVTALERERLGAEAGRLRLACQTHVRGPVSVEPPAIRAGLYPPE